MVSSRDFVHAGIIAAAVLAVLLVALSTYGRRNSHPALRFFVWGASTAFLPLTSSIISSLVRSTEKQCDACPKPSSGSSNTDVQNMWTVLLWIVLILIIKGHADTASATLVIAAASPAAGDDGVDSQKARPPVEHLAMYVWLAYLIVLCFPVAQWLGQWRKAVFVAFVVLGFARFVLKVGAFWMATRSFALGKNPRLVSGYMAQLVEDGDGDEQGHHGHHVPPYIVMGESKEHVEENPGGYRIKREALENDDLSSLVTLDRVWRLSYHRDGLLAKRRELRDLCLSYALFKSLRRRLSGYPLAEAGSSSALDFVLRGMDTAGAAAAGAGDADRVFRVLVDELWFTSDFYYSSLPLCSLKGWCAILNYLLSVLIIVGAVILGWIYQDKKVVVFSREQKPYYVITFALLLAVVLIEAWEIVADVCSNWTKMALLGHYIRHESLWRRSDCVHGALSAVLLFKPARRWHDKIRVNSVLEPHLFRRPTGLLAEQLYGRAGLMKSVQISPGVKEAVLRSLRRSYEYRMTKGSTAARRAAGSTASVGGDVSSSTTEHILAWHVATRLFETKHSHSQSQTLASADRIAACQLSYYCAYLAAAAPELLPDSQAWAEKRYKDVVDDVKAALGGGGASRQFTSQSYERVVKALGSARRDKVLQHGADLGKRLAEEYREDEASAWLFLADFWSEMLLFVAPSENVKGHVEAMARGGEFITLVWALLMHAGVTTRPDTPVNTIP